VLVGWLGWIAAGAATSGNANYPPEHYSRLQ
jgi:hypothetical protein